MTRHGFLPALLLSLVLGLAACPSSEANVAPPAPAMPATWTVKADETYTHNQREFLEVEGRLKGRIKALRITLYEVGGHVVRLHTIVPVSSEEADKIFRILANKKQPWSYLRKDEILYEFAGPDDAEKEISAAREMLAR
jgi:hypothetical protein